MGDKFWDHNERQHSVMIWMLRFLVGLALTNLASVWWHATFGH